MKERTFALGAWIRQVLVARNPDELGDVPSLKLLAYHVDIAAIAFVNAVAMSAE